LKDHSSVDCEAGMPLKYPAAWKFDGFPHRMPDEADGEFFALVKAIAEGAEYPKGVYEDFKSAFGVDAGSTSASWAVTDLVGAMEVTRDNAARYVASFYTGIETVRDRGIEVPNVEKLNNILTKWDVPLVIDPPHLYLKEGDISFAATDQDSTTTMFVRGPMIGRGGFGAVYHVTRRTKIGEFENAMKVFEPIAFVQNKERAEVRFKREVQALGKLQHRGIVPLIEAGIDDDQKPYLLMPYIVGANVRDALSGAPTRQVLHAFDEILHALQFAHAAGVIHRDLKPSNVLIRASDRQPIILDFGCAYLLDEVDDSLTTTLVGTSAYMPNEVLRNPKHRTVQQDVYACGVLLYEVVMGRLPHPEDYAPIEGTVRAYKGIDNVIQTALAVEKKRYPTAEAMRSALFAIQFADV
jgi:predicted Ser/Thr protein kinase